MKIYEVFCYELDLLQIFTTETEARAFYTDMKEKHPKADITISKPVVFFPESIDEVQHESQ